jgi:hypothetical protein
MAVAFRGVTEPQLLAVGRFKWEHIIRRIVVPPDRRAVKLVALMLATFADSRTGQRVRPGEQRLADMCQLGPSTVRAALKWLRENGLIYRQQRGSNLGLANRVDVYQLCVPSNWENHFPLLPEHGKDDSQLIVRPRRKPLPQQAPPPATSAATANA